MFEKTLKTILAIMLIVLFMQKIAQPSINDALDAKNRLANMRASMQHITTTDPIKTRNFMKTEQQMIQTWFAEIDKVLPDYQATRVNAISNLEALREKHIGIWQIAPNTQPLIEESLVRWPVRITYESDFASVLRVIQSIENDVSMSRILSVDMAAGKTAQAEITINLELLFRNSQQKFVKSSHAGGDKI